MWTTTTRADPLYKVKLAEQSKKKENNHRMTSTQRFVPLVLTSTGAYSNNVANVCRHPGLRTAELESALVERLTPPLDSISHFVKTQMVMRVVKGTAANMLKLVERLCDDHGVPRCWD